MNKYLLDTNICIFYLWGDTHIAEKIVDVGRDRCAISVITLYELMFGAFNSGRRNTEIGKIRQFVKLFPVIELGGSEYTYAEQKIGLRKAGKMIDEFDLLIAATAIANGYTLVTDNTRHFERIKELRMENWRERTGIQEGLIRDALKRDDKITNKNFRLEYKAFGDQRWNVATE